MPNLASQFAKEEIEQSLEYIIKNEPELKGSTRWNLIYKNREFPPKEVVRWAARLKKLEGWETMTLSGGANVNVPLMKLGFNISEKSSPSDPRAGLITQYKALLKGTGFADEAYKWQLVEKFKGRPDLDVSDFAEEIRSINFSNLIYGVGIGVIQSIARAFPEEYRNCFRSLFRDDTSLNERVNSFTDQTLDLYRRLEPNISRSHHHDERTIATILTYHNPDDYAFFKDSFYQKFCKLIGEEAKMKGEKYAHYLDMLDTFISEFIEPDEDLLIMVNTFKQKDFFEDNSYKLLAQDILYRTLEKNSRTFESIINELDVALREDESIGFKVLKRTHGKKRKYEWVWVSDLRNKIGDATAHYEIEYQVEVGKIFVYMHFEQVSSKRKFHQIIGDSLPDDIEWIDWFKAKSLRYTTPISIKDENVVNGIINRLVHIDEKLGGTIRNIIEGSQIGEANDMTDYKGPVNQILFGPPGTGKTYNTINKALEILGYNLIGKTREEIKGIYKQKIEEGQVAFSTFHQSMSYEDFIEGIKPETINDCITYHVKDGIFKKLCNAAKTPNQLAFNQAYQNLKVDLSNSDKELLELKTPTGKTFAVSLNSNDNLTLYTGANRVKQGTLTKENIQKQINGEEKFIGWEGYFLGVLDHLKHRYNYVINNSQSSEKKFVLIIDEINRGNVSQIFGELITLIEEDKRLGKDEALEVILPYSKERFGVPSNLYILGTMNTADRSVEALDTALRRRFSFEEMMPDFSLSVLQKQIEGLPFTKSQLLETINKRIELLKDRDHQIGHAYLIYVQTIGDLLHTFKDKILPLLQEYFYGDYEKIQLVLGKGFVGKDSSKTISFAEHDSDLDSDYEDNERYYLIRNAFDSPTEFVNALSLMRVK